MSIEKRSILNSLVTKSETLEVYLKKIWCFGYSLLLLLPWMLVLSRGIADGIIVAISLLFLFHSYKSNDWQWTRNIFFRISIIILLWFTFIVSPFSDFQLISLGSSIAWIRFILFFEATRNWLLTNRKYIFYMIIMLAGLLVFCSLDTLWQYITGVSITGHKMNESGRLTGPMDNVKVGIFMAKLLLGTSGALLFFSFKEGVKKTILAIVFLIFCYSAILISGERTAFAVSSLSMFAVLLMLAFSDKKQRKICFVLVVLAISISGTLFYTQEWLRIRLNYTVVNLSDFWNSSYGKLITTGYEMGKQNLFTGVGIKSFAQSCYNYVSKENLAICELNHPHNAYIEWFAESGLVGVFLFIAMIFVLIKQAVSDFLKNIGKERIIPAFAIAACIMNFFPFSPTQSFFSNWPAILLWLSMAVSFSSLNLLKKKVLT